MGHQAAIVIRRNTTREASSPDIVGRTFKRPRHSVSGHSIADSQRRVVELSRGLPSIPMSRR